MPHHARNASYCPICDVQVINMHTHQTRSKTHLRLYEPIRQRMIAQRAAQRRIKNEHEKLSAPSIESNGQQV